MIESRRQTGQWRRIAPPPGSTQSTSRLFCAAESEINRIVTLGAVPGRTLPRSKPERSPRLLNEVSTGIEYRLPPGSCRVRRWPVNYRKLTDHARQTGKRLGSLNSGAQQSALLACDGAKTLSATVGRFCDSARL